MVGDINDAREVFTRKTQVAGKRELPFTGVINLKSLIQGLVDIGYDSSLRTEPQNQAVNELENEEALEKIWPPLKKHLHWWGFEPKSSMALTSNLSCFQSIFG